MSERVTASRRTRASEGMVVVLSLVGLLAIGAAGVPSARTTSASMPAAIGEHSALAERRVDELNAAIASGQRPRGEHAGVSRSEYHAAAALDGGR